MWERIGAGEGRAASAGSRPGGLRPVSRRAYYRVGAWIPVRIHPLAQAAVGGAIFDLSLPDPLASRTPVDGDENSPWGAQLRRIEEKLDRLLGAASLDLPTPLSGRDRRWIVFSGAGLSLEVEFDFVRGDAFRVELLLPTPTLRPVRAVGEAVADSPAHSGTSGPRRLALAFRHIESSDRDALVAYSYDIQRLELRAKGAFASTRP